MRVVVVGAGILGTAHAWQAVVRGHEVVHLEREREARGASVRNFGLVWVSGRSPVELPAALRSRELWEELATDVPDIGFRPNGSLTLVRTPAELAVAEEAAARSDAAARGFTLLDAGSVRRRNPALRGDYLAGLHCALDGAVESRVAPAAIRAFLDKSGRYTFHPGREVVGTKPVPGGGAVAFDDAGERHVGDVALLCTGAALGGLVRDLVGELAVQRVRLQMMQTEPLGEKLTTSIADGDSFRYYPAFAGPALDRLRTAQPQAAIARQHRMQLLCVQRLHGGLTIGDTHAYDEPFDFDLDDAPYRHLTQVVEGFLGRPLPPVARRWSGVYAQVTAPDELVHRVRSGDVWVVTGPGGRGMTLGPAPARPPPTWSASRDRSSRSWTSPSPCSTWPAPPSPTTGWSYAPSPPPSTRWGWPTRIGPGCSSTSSTRWASRRSTSSARCSRSRPTPSGPIAPSPTPTTS